MIIKLHYYIITLLNYTYLDQVIDVRNKTIVQIENINSDHIIINNSLDLIN